MPQVIDNIIYSDDLKTVEKAENEQITTAIIKEGVTEIGEWAFNGCSNLQNVVIPEGVTTIGEFAFHWCEKLQSVVIPEGVTTIGRCAFNGCTNLQSIVISEGVTTIEEYAFGECTNLQSIVIPEGVTTIGSSAFKKCKIENYEHKIFKVKNGCFLSSDGKTLLYCANDSKQEVVIPEGVTEIGECAFWECTNLQSVVIPEGVTTIEARAFDGCTNLQNVAIPEGVTTIGRSAFEDCTNLQSVVIPEGVTTIENKAFKGCTNLQNIAIPEGVTEIGEWAFYECKNLQNVVIPDSVTEIGREAFQRCKIENYEHKLFKIKNGCFLSSDGKEVLYCTNYSKQEIVIPEGVTTIGERVFGCLEDNLKNIVLPSSVTMIRKKAFSCCETLQEVKYLGTAKEWGKVKFAKSEEKAEIRKLIKEFALQDAKDAKIKEIQTVSVEGFMNAMKENYPSLNFQVLNTTKTNHSLFVMSGKNATVIQLSSNVSSWSENFKNFLSVFCDEAKTNDEINEAFTTYKIKIAEIKKTFSKPQIEADEMNLFINELPELKRKEVYVSASGSFFYNAKIKKLTFARNTLIDWCTFSFNKSFESIILPKGVTEIGEGAFYECKNLQSVVIPEGVTEIGRSAFFECKNLQSVAIPEGVTTIENFAFFHCTNLQNVAIPSSVTSIGISAFLKCTNLQNVVIPEGVTEIGERAFEDCTNLQSVVIPSNVTTIGSYAFQRCKIENYEHKIFKVKDGCFLSSDEKTVLYCTNYSKQEIVIPEGVTTIGGWAFSHCTNLQSVVIPEGVTTIGRYAFEDCPNLQNIVIPSSVTKIESVAFVRCTNLQNVAIPSSVTSIGKSAFFSCTNLTVTFDGTKEEWEKIEGVKDCDAKNVKFNK